MIRFSHGAATSVGRVRHVNEDSYLALPPLFVVADGMGGHGSGDLASRIAIEEMTACVPLRPLFPEAVLTALEHANRHIVERDAANHMGTTVTGLAALETVGGDHLMVFNVGDSRVYRLSGDRLEQLTVDHSEVQELVLAGVITREQARTHPRRNVVTRALGIDAGLLPDHWLLPAIAADRYLICSDGLFSELPDEVIQPLLAAGAPQQAAETLVAAANDAGGRDNVTVVVVDVDSHDDAVDETPPPREFLGADGLHNQPWGSAGLPVRHNGTVGNVPAARHLLRAKDLADARYFERLTVADLAAAAGLSPAHFSRQFRAAFGESPHQYLLTRRLERASALLRATDWSVAAVCFAVGAQSLGSFTASFHRVFGMPPLAYRAAYPPAESHLRIPRCVALAYGRPQNRTFREDKAVPSP